MKKFLIIIGSVIAGLFLLLLILPFAFSGKIDSIVKNETNKQLNAVMDYKSLSISLIRNFPKATIELNNLTVVGKDEFAKDTLVSAKSIQVAVNVMSLFGDNGYEVSKIALVNPVVNAIVAKDGKVNWDIMKPDTTATAKADTTASKFHLKLQKLTVDNARIAYNDFQAGQKLTLDGFSGTLSGDMTADVTSIATQMKVARASFAMGNIPYLNNNTIDLTADVTADLKNNKYTLKKNSLKINALELNFDGWLALLSKGMDMDLKLSAPTVSFKEILSLVPAIYSNDFNSVQTDGKVSMDGFVKGHYEDAVIPSFKVELAVANAWFKYPNLPKSVTNININLIAQNSGNSMEQIQLQVPKFHLEMGGNPFDLSGTFSNLFGNTAFSLAANGKVDLGGIKEFYPLPAGTDLSGLIAANLSASGNMGQVQSGNYQAINASGMLQINGMNYKSKDMPPVHITQAQLQFTPQYAELSNTTVTVGKSDVAASGKLENIIPYVMKNQTITGSLNVSSNYLDLNELMGSSSTSSTSSTSTSALEVPKNIDFVLNATAKRVVYNKFDISNLAGQITVKDGVASMKNVKLNIFDGSIVTNGSYSSADPQKPAVNFDLNVQQASFTKTFTELDMVQKLMPVFEKLKGTYSVTMNLKTLLDNQMNVDYNSLTANGVLQSNNVQIGDIAALNSLASVLKADNLKNISTKDLKIPFTIANGKVQVQPFDVKLGNYALNLGGKTGLDQTIDYAGKVSLPDNFPSPLGIKLSNVPFTIGGTFTSPKVSLNTADIGKAVVSSALSKVTGGAVSSVDDAKAAAQKAVQQKVDQIKAQAKAQADAVMSAAQAQADQLVSKATNPIAKLAAQKAADVALKAAQKKADDIIAQGDAQAQKVQDAANNVKTP